MSFLIRFSDGSYDRQDSLPATAEMCSRFTQVGEHTDVLQHGDANPLVVARVSQVADGFIVQTQFPPNPPKVGWINLLRALLAERNSGDST